MTKKVLKYGNNVVVSDIGGTLRVNVIKKDGLPEGVLTDNNGNPLVDGNGNYIIAG